MEVWPFLLGVYDLDSTESDRATLRTRRRKVYERLRQQCRLLQNPTRNGSVLETIDEIISDAPCSRGNVKKASSEAKRRSGATMSPSPPHCFNNDTPEEKGMPLHSKLSRNDRILEDFSVWQRLIRLDAMRVESDGALLSADQAAVTTEKAVGCAEAVGLGDYDHLEPYMIYHASRLVAILEAYAVYDPEIGYCQGMSDLLSPIVSVMQEDHDAFWCIWRQLKVVSQIIKHKDSHLYRHLEKLQAADCFFVYRIVLVLFRRELTFEQTLCLWEVIWADQAAIRAGVGQSVWGRMKLSAPPNDDLLLYAVASCILQRRKQIIRDYDSMDEIVRECNSMSGHLDVWRLLDDAHSLAMNLHGKVQPFALQPDACVVARGGECRLCYSAGLDGSVL